METLSVEVVRQKSDFKEFIKLPWRIYKEYPNWVPPLILELKKTLSRSKNPFFEHSEAEFFLARLDGRVVGRVAAIRNNNHLKIYNDDVGFFGFFESIDDQNVAESLLGKASQWLKDRGLKKIRGPMSYSVNDECGLLVDGFQYPPVVMMPYNPPYYKDLIESAGFKKAIDLYAYEVKGGREVPKVLTNRAEIAKKRGGFTVRKLNMKRLDDEVERIKAIYNSAWSENWGAVPLTDREINNLKNSLKKIVDPDIVFFAEIDNKPVGVSLSIPDINEALIKINGRLLPFGLLKLLWYSRKIKTIRTMIMGVVKEYRNRGIDTVFYYETYKRGLEKGYNRCEMSWILENNIPMRRALGNIRIARIYKTYRIYEKPL